MRSDRALASALALVCIACMIEACGGDAPTGGSVTPPSATAPTLLSANVAIAAVVGTPLTYDASKGGAAFSGPVGSLTYTVSFAGPANGLTSTGATITGSPTTSGITMATITATDGQGRVATDRFAIVVFGSSLRTPVLATSYQYTDAEVPLPAHFLAPIGGPSVASMDNTPATNRVTDAGATLGRVLFYDTRLSANDATSCGSCHRQSLGFADALPLSIGFAGAMTSRHATGLANARFYQRGRFFWDERAPTLEAQVLEPIQNGAEMGMKLDELALKLSVTSYYPALFTAAFGTPTITSDRIAAALAQFTRSLVSSGSRYDRAFANGGPPNFASTLTPQEQQGEQVFRRSGCAACHTGVVQMGDGVHVTGLDAVVTDTGAGGGAFKTPSLRNVAVRPRFMHDGRFGTLAEVVSFYDTGVQANPNLDRRMRAPDGTPLRLNLTDSDRAALVAFLGALTDSSFLTAPKFSNPFAATGTSLPPGAAVSIRGSTFLPAEIVVAPGTVVSFTNFDNDRHSATFDNPAVGGTPVFTSGTQTVTMPNALGAYTYHCSVHGTRMSGSIIVGK